MVTSISKIGSLSRLVRRAFRHYGRSFTIILILGFIGGLFEGIGIAAVIPLFYVVTGQDVPETSSVTDLITGTLQFLHIPLQVVPFLLLIVGLFAAKGIVKFTVRYYNARIIARFEEHFRKTVFRRMMHADWPFLMKQKSGYLESILLYDTERGTAIMNLLANIILIATTFAAYAVIALNISIPITLTTLVLGMGIFYALKPVLFRVRRLMSEVATAQKELAHHVSEHQASVKSIKAMGAENPVTYNAYVLFARVRRSRVMAAFLRQSTLAAMEPLGFIVIAVLFFLNYQNPGFEIASFAVTMFLVQRMFTYVQSISSQLQGLNENAPYLRVMMDWRRRAGKHEEADPGIKEFSFNRQLRFENINFAYRTERPVLTGINLTIPRGHIIGVVGASGAGKTTIVDLLLRLFEPTSGQITIDGIDARDIYLASWRNHFGYVPQDGVLLDTSIRDNVRFYSSTITEKDIVDALKQANIYETVADLPEGFDTLAGGHGVNLSGGQRQRILLARALARKPEVLILDEATSAVDSESETAIREAITNLRGQVTVIIVAHRLSSIMDADTVAVLENGSVAETGNPRELLHDKNSHFARLNDANRSNER